MRKATVRIAAVVLVISATAATVASGLQQPVVETLETSTALASRGRLGGVSVDAQGRVLVSNFSRTLWRVDRDGTVEVLLSDLQGSSGNAVAPDGSVLQASFVDGRIVRRAPDGSVTTLASGLRGPVGIVAHDGGVFVCECQGNAVARIAPDGAVAPFAASPDLDCPNGITAGPDGALYVVSFNNGEVVRLDLTGRATRFATVPEGRNAHIAYADGAFWVTKIESNLVYRVGLDGTVQRYAGNGEVGFADGAVLDASLARPNGIAATPGAGALVVNTLRGPWRGDEDTEIVLRRVTLPSNPVAIAPLRVEARGMAFDALAAGPPDGELVLLLHGFPQTGYSFRTELLALGEAGYRAVAVDQRGYSPDARPSDPAAYAMSELVGDVAAIADALEAPQFHLVGHDWGGAVAWVVATRFPQRVRTLTVLSTPHFLALGRGVATAGSEQAQRSSYFTDFAADDAAERFLANDMALFRELMAGAPIAAADLDVYRERLSSLAAMRAALNWYRSSAPRPATAGSAATTGGNPTTPAAAPAIPPIRVPTLYLWGTEDGAFARPTAEATAEFVAGPYSFHPLEGVGHWIPEQASDTVIRLLLEHLRVAQVAVPIARDTV